MTKTAASLVWVVPSIFLLACGSSGVEEKQQLGSPAEPLSSPVPQQPGIPEFGPQDFALVEATVVSADGTDARVRIDRILELRRDTAALWPPLNETDEISVTVSIAKSVPLPREPTGGDQTGATVSGSVVDLKDFSEERISEFMESLVGSVIVLSMNCGAPDCIQWFEGRVHEVISP